MTEAERLDLLRRLRLVGRGRDKTQKTVTLPAAIFDDMVKAISGHLVEDSWYLGRYPDVDGAIKKGRLKSATDHFCGSGLYEGRVPYAIEIDEADYLKQHRDVAQAIDAGTFISAADHFYQTGFAEGRAFKLAGGSPR